jgi:hypothetical protein
VKVILLIKGQDDRESTSLLRLDDGSIQLLFLGNVSIESCLEGVGLVDRIVLGISGNKEFQIRKPDLVVNAISDADANRRSLTEAVALVRRTGDVPVINHPDKVLKTGRQSIAQMAADIPGLMAPPVVVMQPRRLREIEERWRSGAIPHDFVIRPYTGDNHGGHNMLRVSSEEELGAIEQFAFDGGPFGIAPFVDYRSRDGYYRKYRIVFINGEPYPRHLIIRSQWMIHSHDRLELMTDRPDLQVEEQRYLANPREVIGPKAWAGLHELARRTKLNFVGMDFSLLPDGRALLFECNAAMNVLGSGAGGGFAYLSPVVERIQAAMTNMVAKRL